MFNDLRYAVRMLAKTPGSTVLAVTGLALGIGVNCAIFSVINALFLRSLPFREPERLVMVWGTDLTQGQRELRASLPDFMDWLNENDVFERMAAFNPRSYNLMGRDQPLRILGQGVSADFFRVLGVNAAVGRTFLPTEIRGALGQHGKERVAVISDSLWKRVFGGDPQVIGQTVLLDSVPPDQESFVIIGVMPAGFQFFHRQVELWAPLEYDSRILEHRESKGYHVIARLKPNVTLEQAQTQMTALALRLEKQYPFTNSGYGVALVPIRTQYYGTIEWSLALLFGATALVLLIACANVANFLLARSVVRRKEIAIRRALGAGPLRILRQLLTESLLLGGLGGLVGLLLASWGTRLIPVLIPADLETPLPSSFRIDSTVLLFTLAVSLLTGVLFGLSPTFEASKIPLVESLKDGGQTSVTRRSFFSALVILETALCLVLVTLSGLVIKSFFRLQSVDRGFNSHNLLTLRMIPLSLHGKPHQMIGFYKELLQRVETLPGIISASVVSRLPGTDSEDTVLVIEGRPEPKVFGELGAAFRLISPGYFETLGTSLLRGRTFTDRDTWQSPGVVIINQTMARLYWPGEDPIGKRVRYQYLGAPWFSVVGVVGDVPEFGMKDKPNPQIYYPFEQNPIPPMSLMVRTVLPPESVFKAIQAEVWQMNKNLALFNVSTMEELVSRSIWQPRFNMVLFSLFGGLALLLAMIGIYSVMSYAVTQRTHEIGIRIALGAQPNDVVKLVVTEAMLLLLIGLAVGFAVILVMNRIVSSLLYELSPTDPSTLLRVSSLLILTAFLASYLPARRATKIDPTVALRYE